MKAKFTSADGLSLETEIQYPPMPRMVRRLYPDYNMALLDEPISIETRIRERMYELRSLNDGIAQYHEVI